MGKKHYGANRHSVCTGLSKIWNPSALTLILDDVTCGSCQIRIDANSSSPLALARYLVIRTEEPENPNWAMANPLMYQHNPITPNRLFMVLYRAIWPTTDAGSAGEAEMARNLAIKYLQEVTPADLPQLQDVLFRVWEGPAKQRGSLEKFNDIYTTAAKTNKVLPATLAAFSNLKIPGSPGIKLQSTPPPKSSPPPKTEAPPKASQSVASKQPESRATCKACDGKGYTTKIDKENVIKEGKRITCSRCGGTGFEPPPSTGKKGGFWRGSRQQQTPEEEDINRATDTFLKKHGFDKWGRP